MTAEEKAQELLDKMSSQTYSYQPYAGANYNIEEIGYEAGKKCALIAVNEILNLDFNIKFDATERCVMPVINFWEEVKQEIEKL